MHFDKILVFLACTGVRPMQFQAYPDITMILLLLQVLWKSLKWGVQLNTGKFKPNVVDRKFESVYSMSHLLKAVCRLRQDVLVHPSCAHITLAKHLTKIVILEFLILLMQFIKSINSYWNMTEKYTWHASQQSVLLLNDNDEKLFIF